MCAHRLAGDSLTCDRTTPHDENAVGGHTYAASSQPDWHDAEVCDD